MTAVVVFVAIAALMPPVAAGAQAPERISEIRVHGNHTTPDADVLELSGLMVGEPASDARLEAAIRHLQKSGRFAEVEVRRRYLSIADPSQILIMIVVSERQGVSDDDLAPGPLKRLGARTMWLPVVGYADGYGFTYGVRTALLNPLGGHTTLSVPLTWGGERRAGVELQWPIGGGGDQTPALQLSGGVAAYRRVNPYYDRPDSRLDVRARAERAFLPWLRAGAGARTARVSFDGAIDRHDTIGADVTVDTRDDPSFPRNAIYATLGREQLRFESAGTAGRASAGRWTTDLRGYVGLFGSSVLALRGQVIHSSRPLPASEQSLLGGSDTLRGYRAGTAVGDNLAAVSTELRLPLTSPTRVGRFGVKLFVDSGTTWAAGTPLGDRAWQRGVGAGVFLGSGPILIDAAVAWPEHGNPRGHFGLGVTF